MVEQLTQHDPRRIGPFEVLGRLGAGGMGLVYLARSASGRRVAIKTVRTELAEDQLFRVRFTREVEAARAVSGFYTAAVVDADPRAAVPWLATAYVPAPSLEEIVNECGPMPAQAVRWLAAGIAEALQSIHGAGLVHRDLKPSNVLVVEDGPRVIDFGIASGVSNTRLTMTNVAVGTPAYMSPEQARDSRSVTGASDVFSLGSTLVFAATGHAPFHGANPVETVFMLLREGPDLEGLPDELRPAHRVLHADGGRRSGPAPPTCRPSSPRTSSPPAATTAVRRRPGCRPGAVAPDRAAAAAAGVTAGARARPAAPPRRAARCRRRPSRRAAGRGLGEPAWRQRRRTRAPAVPRARRPSRSPRPGAGRPGRSGAAGRRAGADRARAARRRRRAAVAARRGRSRDRAGCARRAGLTTARAAPAAAAGTRARAGARRPSGPAPGRTAGGPGGSGCRTTCGARRSSPATCCTSRPSRCTRWTWPPAGASSRPATWPGRWPSTAAASTPPTAPRSTPWTRRTAPSGGGCRRTAGCTPSRPTAARSSPARAAAASRRGRRPPARSCGRRGGAQTDFETPEAGPGVHDGTVYSVAGRPAARRWTPARAPSAGRTRSATRPPAAACRSG